MTQHITLNGTTFNPTSVQRTKRKIGKLLESVNGGRSWVHRNHKSEWGITWASVSNTVRGAVITIFNLTTTFTFVDLDGNSYTVQCEADDYQQSTDADHYDYHSDELRFDVTLRIHEA